MSKVTFEKFDLSKYTNCLVVTDSNIASLYGISGDNVFLLPQGEEAKCFRCVEQLCSWFLRNNLGKGDTVVAVGGGSIGDTVGFATSIYKRGVGILHVPTTLLAQIDSSIGGKTAIDLDGIKNSVGTFHDGDTLIDVDFLKTLDEQQLANGYGELLKYRMLSGNVEQTYNCGQGKLVDTIASCVQYKQSICAQDPYDKNVRHALNFGHTIGHAMELSLDIAHGVAVANGIYYETLLGAKLGICSTDYADKWCAEVTRQFTVYPLTKQILALTACDKKNADGKVCFVLPDTFAERYFTLEQLEELLLND